MHIRIPSIYFMPKLHKLYNAICDYITDQSNDYDIRLQLMKASLPARPIVSSTCTATTPLSQICAMYLNDIVNQYKSTILTDISSLPRIFNDTQFKHCDDTTFLTFDVESLYTNLDTQQCIQLLRDNISTEHKHWDIIISMLTVVLSSSFTQLQ